MNIDLRVTIDFDVTEIIFTKINKIQNIIHKTRKNGYGKEKERMID